MLVDDAHDKRLIENCHPPDWVNPTPAGKYNLIVIGMRKRRGPPALMWRRSLSR